MTGRGSCRGPRANRCRPPAWAGSAGRNRSREYVRRRRMDAGVRGAVSRQVH